MSNKITVIGFTGAGKTTYLVGMYIGMSSIIKNFTLNATDNNVDNELEVLWDKICGGTAPAPSSRLDPYEFHLAHNFKPVCDFEWLDYPGAFLAGPNSPERQRLQEDIKKSDCLLLIVDGEKLSISDAADVSDYIDKVNQRLAFDRGTRNQITNLANLSAQGISLPPICIVVTKCDLIDVQYQEAIRSILRDRFSAIFDAPERIVLQVSVSLGGPIDENFIPRPFCVEQPIAFSVLTIFINYIISARQEIKKNADYIFSKKGPIDKRYYSKEIITAKENIKNLENLIGTWADHCFNLVNLFSDKKIIYIGGDERNLREYYRDHIRKLTDTSDLVSHIRNL